MNNAGVIVFLNQKLQKMKKKIIDEFFKIYLKKASEKEEEKLDEFDI